MLRKALASFMVFLFVGFSIPNFFIYALNGTLLEPKFYSEQISDETYDFVLRTVTNNLLKNNSVIAQYFTFNELHREIGDVFTLNVFKKMLTDFSEQLISLRTSQSTANSTEPVTISFLTLRESLTTVTNNLAFQIYQSLPICTASEQEQFQETLAVIPSCVPSGTDYEFIITPLSRELERTIAEVIPADATLNRNNETQFIYNFFSSFDTIRFSFLILLISALSSIAFILYKPFSKVIKYEALAFILSGLMGFGISLSLSPSLSNLAQRFSSDSQSFVSVQSYLQLLLNFMALEIQKLALIFVVLGLGLFLIFIFLRKSLD